jgi:hypothetical protein
LFRPSRDGSAIHLACATTSCSCELESATLTVTTASGTVSGDQLTLSFGGTGPMDDAFSATFTGTLEPGTR